MTHSPALLGPLCITTSSVAFLFLKFLVRFSSLSSPRYCLASQTKSGDNAQWRGQIRDRDKSLCYTTPYSAQCIPRIPIANPCLFSTLYPGTSVRVCELSKYLPYSKRCTAPAQVHGSRTFFFLRSPFPLVHDTRVTEYPHVQPRLSFNETQPDPTKTRRSTKKPGEPGLVCTQYLTNAWLNPNSSHCILGVVTCLVSQPFLSYFPSHSFPRNSSANDPSRHTPPFPHDTAQACFMMSSARL